MRIVAIVLITIAMLGCAKPQILERSYSPGQVLSLQQFRVLKDPAAINQHVLYLDKGDTIPLKLRIESDWVAVAQEQVDIVVKQRFFMHVRLPDTFSPEDLETLRALKPEQMAALSPGEQQALLKGIMLFVSKDGTRWAPLSDRKALKQVLGIKGGTLSLGMAMNKTDGVWGMLSIKMIRQ